MSTLQKIIMWVVIIVVLGYGVFMIKKKWQPNFNNTNMEYQSDFEKDKELINEENKNDLLEKEQEPINKEQEEKEDKDCENKCVYYTGENKNKCLEECREKIKKEKEEITETEQKIVCEELQALERDRCLKDRARAKKNDVDCDLIQDINLKKECVNAVAEEVLDNF